MSTELSQKGSKQRARIVKTMVPLPKGPVPVYFGTRVAHAVREVTLDMTLYQGVRLGQVLQALYDQGRKDGARHVKESFDRMMKAIPHKNPGKPKKS